MKKYLALISGSFLLIAVILFSCSKETATFYANIDDFLEMDSTLQPEVTSTGLRHIINRVCDRGERERATFDNSVEIWCRAYLADGVTEIESSGMNLSSGVKVAECRDTTLEFSISFDTTFTIDSMTRMDTTFNMMDSTMIIVTEIKTYDTIPQIDTKVDSMYVFYAENIEYRDFSDTKIVSLDTLIFGLKEGISLLSPGDYGQFFIPTELAYGLQGGNSVPPNADVIYEVQLVRIIE